LKKSPGSIKFQMTQAVQTNDLLDKGRVVQRYNIHNAKVDYFFISNEDIPSYEDARSKQDLGAQEKFGTPMTKPWRHA
jgi:hypothetical protein